MRLTPNTKGVHETPGCQGSKALFGKWLSVKKVERVYCFSESKLTVFIAVMCLLCGKLALHFWSLLSYYSK